MARKIVFVFGSNLAGRHGKGAALEAVKHWGAEYGTGEGLQGNSYAIPTKDENLKTLPKEDISQGYYKFAKFAASNPDIQFLVTPAGSGLAGYDLEEIKELVFERLSYWRNIWFTSDWFNKG